MKFPSRPSNSWSFPSEFFYTDYETIKISFEEINEKYGGILYQYHLDDIKEQFQKNIKSKKEKYIAEIVYFV
jgi:hypothetical protein